MNIIKNEFGFFVLSLLFSVWGQAQKAIPVELGDVAWLRNYYEAQEQSRLSDKAILILFQEVPGCSTCQRYGKQVLKHPLIVEAIEDLFIPLVIYNNKSGHDEEVLKQFKEPSWNNPVVRIVDAQGKDVVERLSNRYTPYHMVSRINASLLACQKEIPTYLSLLEEELQAEYLGIKESHISMYCYWSGEKNIGNIRGVVYTEAGFMDGKEVVKVRYAPDMISYDDLLKSASSVQCASSVYSNDEDERQIADSILGKDKSKQKQAYQKAHDDKYYLSRSDIFSLHLTPLQKTRANSMIGHGLNPANILSPRQLVALQKNKK